MGLALGQVLADLSERELGERGITHIEGEDDEKVVAYSSLLQRAQHILFFLQDRGVRPGSQVIICTPSNEQFMDAFWACQLGGFTAVPVAVGQTHEHRRKFFNIFDELDDPFVFSNRQTLEPMEAYAVDHGMPEAFGRVHERYLAADKVPAEMTRGVIHASNPDDVALIQFSSGSTGSPKGVMLSHANLITNVRGLDAWANITTDDSWICWAPLYHDMGLIACHIAPVVTGINQYFIPTERFARRPLLWLTKAAEHAVTIVASPNFGLRLFLKAMQSKAAGDKLADMNLEAVRIVFNAAEPISAELCEEFHAALEPHGLATNAMTPVYGLAEASVCVSHPKGAASMRTRWADRGSLAIGDRLARGDNEIRLVGCGQAIPDCEFRIVDAAGEPAADDVVGRIEIRGGNVTRGYYGDTPRAEEEWLDTGDLGVFDGDLFIVGRAKDTIILNGVTHHPYDLEWLCAEAGGDEKVVCASVPKPQTGEEVVVVFVVFRGAMEDFVPVVRAVNHALAEGAFIDPYRVVPVRSVPRTTSGKVQRFMLAQSFVAGEFDAVLAELDALIEASGPTSKTEARTEIERTVLEICRTYITTEEVFVEEDLLDKGASSLALVEICEAIDEAYPGVLELEDFLEHTSVASLAAFLDERV